MRHSRSLGPTAVLVLVAAGALTACGDGGAAPNGGVAPPPASNGGDAPAPADPDLPTWIDVTEASGITAENHSGKPAQKDWIVSGMGGGTIALDYDRDGDMDLLIVDGTMLTSEGVLEYDDDWRTKLYRNDGGMRFTDVTKEAGIDIQAFGFGGAACDYDADGDADVFVATWGKNYFLRNNGDGTFEDIAEAAGLVGGDEDMSTACAWGDLNGDGIHDLYVANYIDQWKQIREHEPGGSHAGQPARYCKWRGFNVYCGPPGRTPQLDRLYFGRADGTFKEVSETHLVDQRVRFGFQPVMTDVDNDGDLDIYVAYDTQENELWLNDGTGRLVEKGLEAGVGTNDDVMMQAGMGVDAADVNQDGRIDLLVTNFSHDHNTLYINGTRRADSPTFSDHSHRYRVAKLSYLRLCWGTRMFDMDCDADLDMFVACGHVYGEIDNFAQETGTSYKQKNLLLRNMGAPSFRFEDVTEQSGPAFQVARVYRGACFGDFDDDGDQDVFATALNDRPTLYRNDGGNKNAFLRFRLVGPGMQLDPSGARVYVTLPSGVVLMEELHHGASFCGDNDPRLHFGTGAATSVPKVAVKWMDGTTQEFTDVATRAFYVITHGEPELTSDGVPTGSDTD